ncbi:MAG: hypothetical protein ABR529_15605 [Actinomycetota bacterium]
MSEERAGGDLTVEELEQHGSEQLPEREEMSLINTNIAGPR